jgi:H+/Cl- antiporter ClcA
LNRILAAGTMSTELVLTLLVLKLITTAVAAGSGLVGGTFAPSLFFGAMLGAALHDLLIPYFAVVPPLDIYGPVLDLADVQAYALVGAGSVLAALFRAPLTASLLLFELTRDYDFILPLMASAGVGSVVADLLDKTQEKQGVKPRRDQDTVSWGDLSVRANETAVVVEMVVVATAATPTQKD